MIARLLFLVVLAAPRVAFACATCVASAYGDRTFNWAFLGLILMPFMVGAGIASVFAARYYAPYRRWSRGRLAASRRVVAGPAQLDSHEERAL